MSTSPAAVVETGSIRFHRELRAVSNDKERKPVVLLTAPGLTRASALAQARAIASSLGRPLHRIDLDHVVSKYIGETEKNLSRLLEKAGARGAILFFDEADALFGKRTGVRDAHDRYANQEVSYLLSRLTKMSTVIVLAAQGRVDVSHLPTGPVHLVAKAPAAPLRKTKP